MEEEQLQEIQVIAQRKYPGRTWEQLSPEEQDAVFAAHEGQRAMANNLVAQGADMQAGARKEVGPVNNYVNDPQEVLSVV